MIPIIAALAIYFAADTPKPLANHVVRKVAIGGTGGWDYVTFDPKSRDVYVSHGDRVEVIDADTGRVAGVLPARGVHGIALAPDLSLGYISNGRSGTMMVFDMKKFTVVTEVKTTGENPDAILYDPSTQRVFTFNGRGKNATVFDATNAEVLGTIDMGGKPEFAVSDGEGRVYVNIEDKNQIAVIDPKEMTVTAQYPLDKCQAPTGLAIDRKNGRLFSGCAESKTMTVVDTDSGKTIASVPIGAGVDGVAFDEERGLAFASNGADGTVTVVRGSKSGYSVAGTIDTARGARTVTLDPKTHHLFLPTADFGPTPAATPDHPHPRAPIVDGSFRLLEVAP